MDKRVEIHGTSRADMNGKRGVATDFHWYEGDVSKWRYTVQLDSGEAYKLKPANCAPRERAVGAARARRIRARGRRARGRRGGAGASEA